MKICVFCGVDFSLRSKQSRKMYCSDKCASAAQKQRDKLRSRGEDYIKSVKVEVVPYQRKEQPLIETDADQARIKAEIDIRHGLVKDPGRSLKGTPEWEEAVAAVSRPGTGRKVSALYGLCFGSNKYISMRDNRNERNVRYR